MKQIKQKAAFWVAALLVTTGRAQTSVYDCLVVPNSAITSGPSVQTAGCFDFSHPSNYNYPSGANKEFKAHDHIRVQDYFRMRGPASGKFKLSTTQTNIVLYEPVNLNAILQYEKMELGIDLPDDVQARVDAFIANEAAPTGLNPFLDWKIKITATFTHSLTGQVKKVDAFYFRDFEREVIPYTGGNFANNDDPAYKEWGGHWNALTNEHPFRIRFAPPQSGLWNCSVKVYIENNPVATYSYISFPFMVAASANPGFVKVGANKRFFTRGNETFVPIGPNFGWPDTYKNLDPNDYDILTDHGNTEGHRRFTAPLQTFLNYEEHLNELGTAGANHFRMIMVPWSLDIEFEKLGNYYDRLNIAWEMDNIVNTAKQNNLNIQWDFMIQYTLEGNPFRVKYWDWYAADEYDGLGIDLDGIDFDPYYPPDSLMAYDKGYCYHINDEFTTTSPYEMFTDPQAKKYYKQRLRYIVSRWGYSTNIGMWELCSEINNTGGVTKKSPYPPYGTIFLQERPYKSSDMLIKYQAEQTIEAWHQEMADYIKNVLGDPRPISASYGGDVGTADDTHELSVIDFVSENHYNSHWSPKFVHEVSKAGSYIDRMGSYGVSGKPVSFSETGTLDAITCGGLNESEFEDKRVLWTLPFSGTAIANNWSLWNFNDHWGLFKDVRNFIGDIDLDGENWIPGQYTTGGSSDWDDMLRGDKKANMSYLQSGDKKYGMGVINNCTQNAYSRSINQNLSCLYINYATLTIRYGIFNNDLMNYPEIVNYKVQETISAGTSASNWLRIRNMNSAYAYTVAYFDIESPLVPIASQIVGPGISNIVLQYPDLDNDHPMIAFKIYPTTLGWKSAQVKQDVAAVQEMQVYPNPTAGQFTLEIKGFDAQNKNQQITIYNSLGERLQQVNLTSERMNIDLSPYKNGIYLVAFSNGSSTEVVRVSKTN